MINSATEYKDYGFHHGGASHMHRHFLPPLFELAGKLKPGTRVIDVGCGNGFTAGQFFAKGCEVVGIDLSHTGVTLARAAYPGARFEVMAADDQLLINLGGEPFDLAVSTEVIEHLYDPRAFIRGCKATLKPGGRLILSTPYHGYLKNLLISALGKWDRHANPLWDGGHIKLWSRNTLTQLLVESGFSNVRFRGAGRVPLLWMTMLIAADLPS